MKRHRGTGTARAFTLLELLLAAVLSVLVALAATSTMSQFLKARAASDAHQQAYARADAAASLIATDLLNTIRNSDLLFAQVSITNGPGFSGDGDELLLLVKSTRPVRNDLFSPEGEDYEVQYRVEPGPEGGPALWRRVDPAFDPYIDGGGVAVPSVPKVVSLSLAAYDGSQWFDEWRSDEHGLPHAVRVTLTAVSDDSRERVTAQRIIAIDRVPLPPVTKDSDSSGSSSTPTSSGASGGSSSRGGGGS